MKMITNANMTTNTDIITNTNTYVGNMKLV